MNKSDEFSNVLGSDCVPTPAAESLTDANYFASVNESLLQVFNGNDMISSSDPSVNASAYNSEMNSMQTTLQDNEGMGNDVKESNCETVTTECKQNMWIENNTKCITTVSDIQTEHTLEQTHDVENVQSVSSSSQQPVFNPVVHPTCHSRDDLTESTSTLNKDSINAISDNLDGESCPTNSTKPSTLSYIECHQLKSAPHHLFDKPFPTEKNLFKRGQKLECIDPRDQTKFCVVTVTETLGYRVKLHFDGFHDMFDFWVNADSPHLFYPKWCEKNSRELNPPKNYETDKIFSWDNYLQLYYAEPAPISNFVSNNIPKNVEHQFCIGAKLEAMDIMSPNTNHTEIICVATVADVLGDRVLIHFDGWPKMYDYWTNVKSTNFLYPVGWCEMNGRSLIAPLSYRRRKYFTWSKYLTGTKSVAVPTSAFFPKPIRTFSINMTIEIVDLVVPSIIRIAKIIDVQHNDIKVLYDGFDVNYAYWIENDSPDIYPVGWCLKTDHPITVPPADLTLWICNYHGCTGNYITSDLERKHIEKCPYELVAWNEKVNKYEILPHRLTYEPDLEKTNKKKENNTPKKTNKRRKRKQY